MKKAFNQEDETAVAEFKAQSKTWEMPLLMSDVVVMTLEDDVLKVLLMRRAKAPARDCWALPGAFTIPGLDASSEQTALRGLREKTDVDAPYLEQLRTFSGPERDPRGWSCSSAYICVVARDRLNIKATAGPGETRLMTVSEALSQPLAFDHAEILASGVERLRAKGNYSSLAAHLLPKKFTLSELQKVYEIILQKKQDKAAFRKKIADAGFARPCPGEMKKGANRPAQLYELADSENLMMFRRTLAP